MMSEIDERLERLINRSLDGDLSEDEQLELDRELIRNPQARQLRGEYEAIDQAAAGTLRSVLGSDRRVAVTPANRTLPNGHRWRWFSTAWWLVPGAIAAALLATVVPYPSMQPVRQTQMPVVSTLPFGPADGSLSWNGPKQEVLQPARTMPAVHRNTGRDLIGVVGDDGNLYWIEVQRTRTVKLPKGSSARTQPMNEF